MPSLPVLMFFLRKPFRNTLREVRAQAPRFGYRVKIFSYERLGRWPLPAGAAVLTDFERLAPWELEMVSVLRQRIGDTGAPVLNDPARFRPRGALLKLLHKEGVNGFACTLPAQGERPARFPVFLRTMAAHRGVIGDLLHGPEEAEAALQAALAAGYPLSDLALIEYAPLEQEGGVFRKRAGFGIGGEIVPGPTVSDHHWVAKQGVEGAASAEDYAADHAELENWPHRALVARVMALSGMDYGRVDFALTAEGPAVFELNTNPQIRRGVVHPDENRVATNLWIERRLHETFAAIAHRGAGAARADLRGVIGPGGKLKKAAKLP